ncbi:MAG: 3-deoxy-8-phosphooctulonate synthase [Candidatus Xiphinematobacter sp.]|nr:MAG: 3-deoxy-8-phosphooctulonate synthase [Candidatus Xiphinematobacter sp.]
MLLRFSLFVVSAPAIFIGDRQLGGDRLLFILGPCVIESRPFLIRVAQRIRKICDKERAQFVFKASYDKANRSSHQSFRGIGIKEGCKLLQEVGQEIGAPVTTDVHSPAEVEAVAPYVDMLQIPAFLCRQTDLILAAASTGRVVNVKKGQFLSPWEVRNIAEKLEKGGCKGYLFTERGTTFGYNNLVADMRSIFWIREMNYRVIFDATHTVQHPGGAGTSSSGDRHLVPVLARAAAAAGCDGIFLETHPNPECALSDGLSQLPLSRLAPLLRTLQAIHSCNA